MPEIRIKDDALNTEVNNLRNLNKRIGASNIKCPTVVGGGSSIEQIENIGKSYQQMHKQLEMLVSSTISFMENINNSYKYLYDIQTAHIRL